MLDTKFWSEPALPGDPGHDREEASACSTKERAGRRSGLFDYDWEDWVDVPPQRTKTRS